MPKKTESEKIETVQFRLEIPVDLHEDLKKVSVKTGVPMNRIILDGARFRCKDITKMFIDESRERYRNQ